MTPNGTLGLPQLLILFVVCIFMFGMSQLRPK
jgi:hypothetical protein